MKMEASEEREFQVQETTILPQRAGMSLLMFDLCCAKPRMRPQRRPEELLPDSERGSYSNRYVFACVMYVHVFRRREVTQYVFVCVCVMCVHVCVHNGHLRSFCLNQRKTS